MRLNIILLMVALGFISCSQKVVAPMASYVASSTTYMYDGGDGSITVRAQGFGRTKSEALKNASKSALRDVIFEGVTISDNALLSRPLVTSPNAKQKHEHFFNNFFKDGGEYERFVNLENRKQFSDEIYENSRQFKVSATMCVLRSDLQLYLVEQGIIAQ